MTSDNTSAVQKSWIRQLGPGLITACVVIGPGSVLTSSQVGASYGFQLTWVLLFAAFLMMIYMTLGARLGVMTSVSAGELITRSAGRWLTATIGISVFCISCSYQFGNDLGVYTAVEAVVISLQEQSRLQADLNPHTVGIAALLALNGLAILFLFGMRNVYRWLERLMMVFVGVMLLSFFANIWMAQPDISSLLRGLIPSVPQSSGALADGKIDWIPVIGWVGTTFIAPIAYYQSYLVQQKKWNETQLKLGLRDARIGGIILGCITLMIMSTAAAELRGRELTNLGQVAQLLRPAFGEVGQRIFCVGVFCAAYSSFLVNSMVGGLLLSDGLGLGSDTNGIWPRILASLIMIVGMLVAMATVMTDYSPVAAIVFAQALTVLAAPLTAAALWWLTNRQDIMGRHRSGWALNVAAAVGFVTLLLFAFYLVAYAIPARLAG